MPPLAQPDRLIDEIRDSLLPRSITAEEMSFIDENSAALGIPTLSLMENAGAAVAAVVDEDYAARGKRILIVSGVGNNGGDGFVVCRHLLNRGAHVDLILLGRSDEIRTAEARANWQVLEGLDAGLELLSIRDSAELDVLRDRLKQADLVVDAILGTGVRGDLREPIASSVRGMNDSGKAIVAVDTPTGLNPSTGVVHGVAVRADQTVTFHKMKSGFDGHSDSTGRVRVAEIGIPVEAELFSGPGEVRRVTIPRKRFSSKKDHGYVLIIGGSEVYSGAPALAALAAVRTGAGLAMVAAPEKVTDVIRSFSPDLIAHRLAGEFITTKDVAYIGGILVRVNSVVIGPGMGTRPETGEAVNALVRAITKAKLPMVIDADAITSLAGRLDQMSHAGTVLTPNAGEFKAISGLEAGETWKERVRPTVEFAKKTGCTILLKGHHTVITDGDRLKVNTTGTPSLATGGTGDVLSGIIAAYLAQGQAPLWAAAAGAYAHGCASALVSKEKGYHATATDLLDRIPDVLKPFDRTA